MRREKSFRAWAIDTAEGHGYIGRYWFFNGQPGQPAPQHEGCQVCLFTTRAQARKALKDVRGVKGDGKYHAFPKAREVRVRVTVKRCD